MIELSDADRLPVDEVVATLAIGAKPPFVLVFVAGNASGRETQVSPVGILDLDRRAFLGRDVRRIVALIAGQTGMLALKRVPGVPMIERLDVPFNEREVFSIVLGVTARALLAGSGRDVVRRVQTFVSGKAAGNLGMAIQTLQRRLTSELVTASTIR